MARRAIQADKILIGAGVPAERFNRFHSKDLESDASGDTRLRQIEGYSPAQTGKYGPFWVIRPAP